MWTRLDSRELATVLAALRTYKAATAENPALLSVLQPAEIDKLCERLNSQPTEREKFIRKLAFDQLDADNVTIVDDGNVYESEEGGAWVDTQMWIEYEVCSKCNAIEGSPEWGTVGDGFDGMCPCCADKEEEQEDE